MLKPNSTVTNNLIKARELIADEKDWCQGTSRTMAGEMCAIGALEEIAGAEREFSRCYEFLYRTVREVERHGCVSEFNDDHDHPAVMRMFDRAIELSLQEPGA